MPEVPINQMSSKQLLIYIAQEVGQKMTELNQHVENQLAQTETERQGRAAAEEALRQAQEALAAAQSLADSLTANDADQEAQIADFRTRAEAAEADVSAAIDRLKSDDPQPEAPADEAPVDEAPADEVDPGTVTDPGTEPTA